MQRRIREWSAEVPRAPKDLLNCLPTFAVSRIIHIDLWEQYIGHAPRSVTGRHYVPRLASGSIGEREALDRQMALFREHVVGPLEKSLAGENPVRILNFFERAPHNGKETARAVSS